VSFTLRIGGLGHYTIANTTHSAVVARSDLSGNPYRGCREQ